MFKEIIKSAQFGDKTISLSTGKMARQADGSIISRMGDTIVLCTVVVNKTPAPDVNFLPLTVHYREMSFAAGKIPGGFIKREGKPSEREVLISRLIDRPIRPLFSKGFYNEVQVICTVLSHDPLYSPDIVAMVGASAALAISGAPYLDIIAAARVGLIGNNYILNPNSEELKNSCLNLVVAGTQSSVLMVESEASELADEMMVGALEFALKSFAPVIQIIKELQNEAGKAQVPFTKQGNDQAVSDIQKLIGEELKKAYKITNKQERRQAIQTLTEEASLKLSDNYSLLEIQEAFFEVESEMVRTKILKEHVRIDGRKLDEIRPITCEISSFPKTHGSALFTRGETQAVVVVTLGTAQDEQIVDNIEGETRESFMLHYNFPPYSVGETSQLRPPGRREIGHGRLALKALSAVIPEKIDFPYAIRLVSEITESNGSSSMATVCGGSLALMDAGVPIARPVAGIAMGLIKEGDNFAVISDILGDEDHLGDMDFKVAATEEGITALQMDIKITGINFEIIRSAIKQASKGVQHILKIMEQTINTPRKETSKHAPAMQKITIKKEKIRDLIGPGGRIIKDICEKANAKIDIDDDGNVFVAATNNEMLKQAIIMINNIILEPEVGQAYEGTIVKIIESGAFISLPGNKDGFLHISEVSEQRITRLEDHIQIGSKLKVMVIGIDKGRIRLSLKRL